MKKISLFLISFLFLISCKSEKTTESHRYNGEALGTTYNIRYFSDRDLDFEKSLDSIIEEINSSMSTYLVKSDISRINRGDTTVTVDKNFEKVFNASNKIFKESDGFFDPTVGVLVNAYGFGPAKPLKSISADSLDSLRNLVGFNKVTLTDKLTIKKEHPAIYLDFNAIAKGYAIDVIAEYLESKDVENYLIELGGELRAKGENLGNNANWVVGIDDPEQVDGERRLQARVKLLNSAMATSGNYRKYRVDSITGQKYVHTINPKTGKAEKSNVLSASVLAENCMLADGYATAFMALGIERSTQLLKELDDVEVYILYSTPAGDMDIFSTPGFKENILD
ncbi:FAD:protein FMN transferase [Christiangramia sabulilitoris]|uniref:FAD:protein FMN transferase n=1 Tax=Christiangramia sabulilitoris TaxID=2583991 RepID=A0A550HZ76_9FLAO|nr:FAD:protein FMN transferase [Christiangramia sabulilitoris]TRO64032.1 FAD:protein FMN transferase [Christiangramia sabulilitoris]